MGKEKDKLILLVGASGTGKTTIAKELEKRGYNIIHSYTTREPREDNEWGHTFISDWLPVITTGDAKDFVGIESGGEESIYLHQMIAYKELYDEHYFATYEQYQGKGTSIYIVDPEGANMVRENVKDTEIVTISLTVDEEERQTRMLNRMGPFKSIEVALKILIEDKEAMAIMDKINNRIRMDRETFSVIECDYTVDANRELKDVLENVLGIVEGQ